MPPRHPARSARASPDTQLRLDLGDEDPPVSMPAVPAPMEVPPERVAEPPRAEAPRKRRKPRASHDDDQRTQAPPPAEAPEERTTKPGPLAGQIKRVSPRSLRPGEAADNYLYLVASPAMAEAVLEGEATGDLLLGERAALPHLFERHAEEAPGGQVGEPVLLRVPRRTAMALLAEDPGASRVAGAPCYRLRNA